MATVDRYISCVGKAPLLLALLLAVCLPVFAQQTFTVVIDAGHGGHDSGAVGRTSKEKNINLAVALKLGKLIENNCSDVKVIYTRKTDVFIALDRRAQIANDAKADLFISVHTNSLANNHTAMGPSTWTLGLAKSDANLEVAKRENSVILYEDDYKTRYAGFDPNSSESYIIFEFMQDKYMSQSVKLASLVQRYFKNTGRRVDNGVHQAGFLVLKASAMPSVLVELGFISTPAEEQYLNSTRGQDTMANCIFKAFQEYRTGKVARSDADAVQPATGGKQQNQAEENRPTANAQTQPVAAAASEAGNAASTDKPVFKIQFLTSSRLLKDGDRQFKGLSPVEYYLENGIYKYTYGASTDYNLVRRRYKEVTAKFKDAFIIAFRGDGKMNVNQAIKEFKNNRK